MSYGGAYDHSQSRRGRYEKNRGGYGSNYYRTGNRGNNQRQYHDSQYNYNINRNNNMNNVSNELQVNASRFARPQNNTRSVYKSRRHYNNNNNNHSSNAKQAYQHTTYTHSNETLSQFDKFAFPNDWNHSGNISSVSRIDNYKGWKASKPKIKYYTSDSLIYPDRVGVPQICSKGIINDIIDRGCIFAAEHFEMNKCLLPSNITLMIFKENSMFAGGNHRPKKTIGLQNEQQDGSQIRLKYEWNTFFKIMWINAKQNKNFGIEIPKLGWQLAAIEKFQSSMKRSVASSLNTALCNGYIEQDKYKELIQYFRGLNKDFMIKQQWSKQNIENNIDDTKEYTQDAKSMDEHEEDIIRNSKETMGHFDTQQFKLSSAEPRFIKKITEIISTNYLRNVLPNELKQLHKSAQELSRDLLVEYEWRIGVEFDGHKNTQLYIEFYSDTENRFQVWTKLKQKLNIDSEGNDNNTYSENDIAKQCANEYFKLMKNIYTKQKLQLLKLHHNEQQYIENKKLLKKLNNCITVLYFPPKLRDGPSIRPSKFKNNWWDCCVKYNYPGREILDKIKLTNNDFKYDICQNSDEFNDEGNATIIATHNIDELTKNYQAIHIYNRIKQ